MEHETTLYSPVCRCSEEPRSGEVIVAVGGGHPRLVRIYSSPRQRRMTPGSPVARATGSFGALESVHFVHGYDHLAAPRPINPKGMILKDRFKLGLNVS